MVLPYSGTKMAFSFSLARRSLTVVASGFIAFVLVWYFRKQNQQRKAKRVEDEKKQKSQLPTDQSSSVSNQSCPEVHNNPDVSEKKVAASQCESEVITRIPTKDSDSIPPNLLDPASAIKTSETLLQEAPEYVAAPEVYHDVDSFKPAPEKEEEDVHCETAARSHTPTSSFVSSLTSSENDGDLEEGTNGNEKTTSLEKGLNLDAEEAPFSWSKEVENSAKKKIDREKVNENEKANFADGNEDLVDGYKPADSPSTHSEHGSQDSGRATGGPASSMSPAQDGVQDPPFRPMYEFEIPNSLVGLIIGIKGKTIRELCTRTNVKMIIRPHHTPSKMSTHQICTVEGPRDNINKCLQMLRRRFPATRFPELNLKPVLPPPLASADLYGAIPTQMSLPEGSRCEILVSAYVDAGHFFIQQPTHPTFPSLQRLDCYMLAIYSQTTGIPDLPRPCETGLLCVAPASGGWYRAVTIFYYDDEDEVLVRFVDYGGYSRVPRADLRQIRTDFMTLPFQATECLLAHVEPVDGSSTWYPEANEMFVRLAMGRMLEAFVVGYSVEDQTPIVELFTVDENNMAVRVDRALLDAGLAKAADPTKMRCVPPKPLVSPIPAQAVTTAESVSSGSSQSVTVHP